MGEARRQHARLAGAGAGQHQHRAVERLDRLPLLRVQPGEIGAGAAAAAPARQCRRGAGRLNGIESLSQRVGQGA